MTSVVGRGALRAWPALLALAAASGCNCNEVVRQVFGEIEVAPASIDFKTVSIGSFSTHAVDVYNNGTAPLVIETLELTDPALSAGGKAQLFLDRVLETDCQDKPRVDASNIIGMGECARFRVRYSPLEFDPIEGLVTITSSDPSDPTVTIPVAGRGAMAKLRVCVLAEDGSLDEDACTRFEDPDPEVAATVPGIDFGALAVGETLLRQVRLFNDGDYPLVVSDVSVASDFPDFTVASSSRTIAAGAKLDFDVGFVPKGNGNRTGRLVVTSDDVAHPRVELPLTARANGPLLCIQPAEGIDFGAVPVLEARTLPVKVSNCGLVPFEVASIALRQNGASSPVDFSLDDAALELPSRFEPGDFVDVEVTFKPTDVATFTAELDVVTAFETRHVSLSGSGAAASCAGTTRPTAVLLVRRGLLDITDHPLVQPLDSVVFDARTSTVPRGGATYSWRLVSQPQNGVQNVVPRTPPSEASLFVPLDGEYVVELVVGDAYGCDSEPVQATLQVRSKGKVHVQLTWAQSFGDLDLHFLGPNGVFNEVSLYGGGSDCFFANCRGKWGEPDYSIDWGLSGTTSPNNDHSDDPTLDIDEMWGHGPENVTHAAPFDGTYGVIAHYFCSRAVQGGGYARDSSGPVDATLKIFVNGEEAFSETRSLTQRDKWQPASIKVSDRGSTITIVPSSQPVTKSTGDIDACTPDTD